MTACRYPPALIMCPQCGTLIYKPVSAVNRARNIGAPLYCGKQCAGLARRKPCKTVEQKKEEKRLYDAQRRRVKAAELKIKHATYYRLHHDRVKEKAYRDAHKEEHNEYCRRPEYKRYKSGYDLRRRANEYGEFAEAYMLTLDLNREIKSRSDNYEIRRQNHTGNKAQERDRASPGPKRDDSHPSAHRE